MAGPCGSSVHGEQGLGRRPTPAFLPRRVSAGGGSRAPTEGETPLCVLLLRDLGGLPAPAPLPHLGNGKKQSPHLTPSCWDNSMDLRRTSSPRSHRGLTPSIFPRRGGSGL